MSESGISLQDDRAGLPWVQFEIVAHDGAAGTVDAIQSKVRESIIEEISDLVIAVPADWRVAVTDLPAKGFGGREGTYQPGLLAQEIIYRALQDSDAETGEIIKQDQSDYWRLLAEGRARQAETMLERVMSEDELRPSTGVMLSRFIITVATEDAFVSHLGILGEGGALARVRSFQNESNWKAVIADAGEGAFKTRNGLKKRLHEPLEDLRELAADSNTLFTYAVDDTGQKRAHLVVASGWDGLRRHMRRDALLLPQKTGSNQPAEEPQPVRIYTGVQNRPTSLPAKEIEPASHAAVEPASQAADEPAVQEAALTPEAAPDAIRNISTSALLTHWNTVGEYVAEVRELAGKRSLRREQRKLLDQTSKGAYPIYLNMQNITEQIEFIENAYPPSSRTTDGYGGTAKNIAKALRSIEHSLASAKLQNIDHATYKRVVMLKEAAIVRMDNLPFCKLIAKEMGENNYTIIDAGGSVSTVYVERHIGMYERAKRREIAEKAAEDMLGLRGTHTYPADKE